MEEFGLLFLFFKNSSKRTLFIVPAVEEFSGTKLAVVDGRFSLCIKVKLLVSSKSFSLVRLEACMSSGAESFTGEDFLEKFVVFGLRFCYYIAAMHKAFKNRRRGRGG